MSVAELPPPTNAATLRLERDVPKRRWFSLTLEQMLYLALFALALFTHLYGLDVRAYHHDETHHAYYSWRLYSGLGYTHDPLLHGPFLYYANALVYFLFGDNNFTARLSVALFGSSLVLMPYMIRRELGRGAALMAAVYLTISPVFLYVGRFIRHDPFAVAFELLTVIGIVRYISTRRAGWLYLVAAALGLMCVTMESFFLYVAIILPLVLGLFLWRVWKPGLAIAAVLGLAVVALVFVLPGKPERSPSGDVVRNGGSYICPSTTMLFPAEPPINHKPGPLLGLPPLPTADNAYGLCVRNQPDNDVVAYLSKLGQFLGHPAILLAMTVLVFGTVGLYVLIWHVPGKDRLTPWQRARAQGDGTIEAFASLGSDRRLWWALLIFFAIYALFFSAFLTNPVGIISGMSGSVLYWLAQHDVQRGGQPGYYYLMELTVYEPLALLWSIIGVVLVGTTVTLFLIRHFSAAKNKHAELNGAFEGENGVDWRIALPVILSWWSIATLFVYSWAGEKMPWLTIHVALPLVFLAAWALGRTLQSCLHISIPGFVDTASESEQFSLYALLRRERNQALLVYLAVVGLISIFVFLLMAVATNNNGSALPFSPGWVPLGALVMIALATVCYGLLRSPREAIGALALGTMLIGGAYTLRSSYQLNYLYPDTPREMMIFVQTSPDVARVMSRLEQASIRRTGGLDMPIWYDNETIWGWYTRRFTAKEQQQPALTSVPGNDVKAVLMLQENIDQYPQNRDKLNGFVIQRLPLRWWFPEDQYRLSSSWMTDEVTDASPLLMRVLRTPLDTKTASQFWQYMLYRKPPGQLGSTDFILATRPELADEIGLGLGAK